MAVFTISRQFGAGGKTLGKMVAETLGYTFADSSIIQMISKQANVSAKWVRSFEKEAGGVMSRRRVPAGSTEIISELSLFSEEIRCQLNK